MRVSGPATSRVAADILGEVPKPRHAVFREFLDATGDPLDKGIALFFRAPHSYTGEDVLELHGHGGPVVLDLVVQRVIALGARTARPGEFSERAFLNGKLDLAQVEAVADLIESGTASAVRAAVRSLQGEFSRRVHRLVDDLIGLRTYVEAAIDFPDEGVEARDDQKVDDDLKGLCGTLDSLLESAQQGSLLRDGMTIVLTGRPNVGKSSLLNALACRDIAIVSSIPGTTRDILHEQLQIDGMPLHVMDTAGLHDSPDEIEGEGMRRAKRAMAQADHILLVIDDSETGNTEDTEVLEHLPADLERTVVRNKIDLSGRVPGAVRRSGRAEVAISAKTGAGIEDLRTYLKHRMGYRPAGEGVFMARRRHLEALRRARSHVVAANARRLGSRSSELVAEELRLAQLALGEITGEFTPDNLLGRIFESFCIGK